MLSRVLALGRLLVLKNVLQEWGLTRGKALPAATGIEEGVSMFKKNGREIGGCLGHGLPRRVLGIGSSGAMIE
jgi:hypothetical protein